SYTLGGFRSFTKVTTLGRFYPLDEIKNLNFPKFHHHLSLNNETMPMAKKMRDWLDSLLEPWGSDIALSIESTNNFPTACGIASSASGYAALCGALFDLLQLHQHFNEEEQFFWLTQWARLGSGSATRSCDIGKQASFVHWKAPEDLNKGFSDTESIEFHPVFEQLQHCVFVLDDKEKTVTSSEGHQQASSSPFQAIRLSGLPKRTKLMLKALREGDFQLFSTLCEEEAFAMHCVMHTSSYPAKYLNNEVAHIIAQFVLQRNTQNLPALWTLDAGPNIHVLYFPEAKPWLKEFSTLLSMQKKAKILSNQKNEGLVIGKAGYKKLIQEQILSNSL
ncbi:MAG: hypothetical protein K2X39_07890, partial [Silvanigrellaceae bacterium]|nr:hypothetical protein [Silvanigrellaceae bacterium]